MSTKESVLNIIEGICGEKINSMSDEEKMECNYVKGGFVDSINFLNLVSKVENNFNIEFSSNELEDEKFKTIGGLINIIDKLID